MTTLLILAVTYLLIANGVHRRRVRQLQVLLVEQLLLLKDAQALGHRATTEVEPEQAPTVTYRHSLN